MAGRFVSRAGEKLDAAIGAFALDVRGWVCADFGCNVGGFTDCLLQRHAAKVYAIDTGYGELAWRLRKDPRVVVMERTNALYCPVAESVDLVVVDVAWTSLALALPAAMRWLKSSGLVISLLKPHYEAARMARHKPGAALTDQQARDVCMQVSCELQEQGQGLISAGMASPLRGKGGNLEFLVLVRRGR